MTELKSVPKKLQNVYARLITTYKNSGQTDFNICLKNNDNVEELYELKELSRISINKIDEFKFEIEMLSFKPFMEIEM